MGTNGQVQGLLFTRWSVVAGLQVIGLQVIGLQVIGLRVIVLRATKGEGPNCNDR